MRQQPTILQRKKENHGMTRKKERIGSQTELHRVKAPGMTWKGPLVAEWGVGQHRWQCFTCRRLRRTSWPKTGAPNAASKMTWYPIARGWGADMETFSELESLHILLSECYILSIGFKVTCRQKSAFNIRTLLEMLTKHWCIIRYMLYFIQYYLDLFFCIVKLHPSWSP